MYEHDVTDILTETTWSLSQATETKVSTEHKSLLKKQTRRLTDEAVITATFAAVITTKCCKHQVCF